VFHSATLKLTGWYLLILMVISLTFSAAIFHITSREFDIRLSKLQTSFEMKGTLSENADTMRQDETANASAAILLDLICANIIILVAGGLVSYLFARRTLQPIKEAHEAQSRFTSDASHELRTPLAVMKAEIEVALRDKHTDTIELRGVLESNLEEVEKLTALSEMLLTLSRMEHDKLKKSSVIMLDVTNDALKLHKQVNRVTITAGKKVVAYANYAAIRELISILIDNALKYSPKDSSVTITLSNRDDDKVCFEISNVGSGIASDRLPHIFDRFYQADPSRTTTGDKGYGLGLSLAKKIVELESGDLTVVSGTNQVTTFTVFLPVYESSDIQ
jgi:two-component system sensor histidine kinase CiaH